MLLVVLSVSLFFISCSSIDGDAKEAAELNTKSMQALMNNNMEDAEKYYKESEAIMKVYADKGKESKEYQEFYTAFVGYLNAEAGTSTTK